MFRYIVVGGRFGDDKKESGYIKKLFNAMIAINSNGYLVNGGELHELKSTLLVELHSVDVVFWFADVDNKYNPKWVNEIKQRFPHCILVTSKNNLKGKYSFMHLIAKALKIKANLFVEFTNIFSDSRKLNASVCDPLGNCFCSSADIDEIATALMCRTNALTRFTRMGSVEYYDVIPTDPPEGYYKFFNLAKHYAKVFHDCIHGANTDRLLGNISYRCENGFPSMKADCGQVFVSMRNIDKREIGEHGMVRVKLLNNNKVGYVGDDKPSVDTPIQLMLYNYYRKMRYMIHSHTYIEGNGAVYTDKVIPCGAIEEFYEIVELMPFRNESKLFINLKGHGSLAMVQDYEDLIDISYIPRPNPEF